MVNLRIGSKALGIEILQGARKDWHESVYVPTAELQQLELAFISNGYKLTHSGKGVGRIGDVEIAGVYAVLSKPTGMFSWEEVALVCGSKRHPEDGQGLAFAVARAECRGLQKLRLVTYTAAVTLAENVTAAGMDSVLVKAGLERILREE